MLEMQVAIILRNTVIRKETTHNTEDMVVVKGVKISFGNSQKRTEGRAEGGDGGVGIKSCRNSINFFRRTAGLRVNNIRIDELGADDKEALVK